MKTVMVPKPKTDEAIMGDQIEMVLWFVSQGYLYFYGYGYR